MWNKLYHRSVFGEGENVIRFPEGKEHEDVYVSHLLIENAGRIAITDCKLYMYRIRRGSITGSKATEAKIRQDLEAQLSRIDYFEKKGYVESLHRVVIGFLLHLVLYNWKRKNGIKEDLQVLFSTYYPLIAESKELKGKYKLIIKAMEMINSK